MSKNPKYYGQSFPTSIPQEFAPGIISTNQHQHSSPTISLDGKECYWSMTTRPIGQTPQKIYFSNFEEGKWNPPQLASFSSSTVDGGPVFSYDSQHLYFYSKRALDSPTEVEHLRIWSVDRIKNGWGEPHLAFGKDLADQLQSSFSLTKTGTFYYSGILEGVENNMGIHRIRQKKGVFGVPELLPPQINSAHQDWIPFIAPDENYLVFSSNRPGSIGFFDLYISFHTEDDLWLEPLNLGPTINTDGSERFPGLTPDRKAFFFIRESEIYWVDSRFLEEFSNL